jgi:hypothetical protein
LEPRPRRRAPIPAARQLGQRPLAIVEADRPKEQREQREDQGNVEAGECGRIDQRPRGERRATRGDEPYLVAFPRGADRVEQHPSLDVGPADERQQHPDTQIKAVEHRKAYQQQAHEQPPDKLQRCVIEEEDHAPPSVVIAPRPDSA